MGMIKNAARDVRDLGRALHRAVQGRIDYSLTGESRVASTCQITGIREIYRDLDLPTHRGVFVEVGAFDGESWSNTSFLADQGWRGVYIEPVPKFYRRMRLRHALNKVSGECVGIADEKGTATISVMGPLSTMNEETEKQYKRIDWAQQMARNSKSITIRTERLDDVLIRNAVPKAFDLMIIDVEGAEEGIVRSLLMGPWRPKVLIVELCDVHPDFANNEILTSSHRRVRESLLADGYREHFVHPINTIFARSGAD